jgi:hypothetical protein
MAGLVGTTPITSSLNRLDISTSGVVPGATQYYTLGGLIENGTTYYIRVFTADEGLNYSDVSNGATAYTLEDNTAPNAINDFAAVTGSGAGEINLSWTAPGDDGATRALNGTYRIYYSSVGADLAGLTPTTPVAGTLSRVDIATTNVTPGSLQRYILGGLISDGTTYYARIFTADEVPNWSDISNGATSYTRDTTAPGDINDFVAVTGAGAGEIDKMRVV